jgi:hypothetical protein
MGAHIAAVPSNGQYSRWAECRDCTQNQRVREKPEVVGRLQYHGLGTGYGDRARFESSPG